MKNKKDMGDANVYIKLCFNNEVIQSCEKM